MFTGNEMSFFIAQLCSHGPIFLVYLAAIVLAFRYINRARIPSTLTLIGVVISAVTMVLIITAQTFILSDLDPNNGLAEQMMFLNIVGGIGEAIGTGFFVAAIFFGRNYVAPADRYLRE